MSRIWRCTECRRTFDLARVVPQLQNQKGRLLTDEELEKVPEGKWHNCPGPPGDVGPERDAGPKMAATAYDWKTGRPK